MNTKLCVLNGFFVYFHVDAFFIADTESKETVRSKRAKKARATSHFKDEPNQNLDASSTENTDDIPPTFLSKSVREYLELGRSIPGENLFNIFWC